MCIHNPSFRICRITCVKLVSEGVVYFSWTGMNNMGTILSMSYCALDAAAVNSSI